MLKLLQITLLYNCILALVQCNTTHNRERNTLDRLNHRLLFTLSTLPWNLFWTSHDFTLSFAHTDTLNTHTQLDYRTVDLVSVEMQETRNHHVSGLCCFVYSPRMWLLFPESGCPANSELGGGSSLQTFDCWGEVRGSDSVQCVKWRQWQRTSQKKKNERSNFRTSAVWGDIYRTWDYSGICRKRVYNNCVRLIVLMKTQEEDGRFHKAAEAVN